MIQGQLLLIDVEIQVGEVEGPDGEMVKAIHVVDKRQPFSILIPMPNEAAEQIGNALADNTIKIARADELPQGKVILP